MAHSPYSSSKNPEKAATRTETSGYFSGKIRSETQEKSGITPVIVDTDVMREPSFKMVLTAATNYAYRTNENVFVVPIGCLRD